MISLTLDVDVNNFLWPSWKWASWPGSGKFFTPEFTPCAVRRGAEVMASQISATFSPTWVMPALTSFIVSFQLSSKFAVLSISYSIFCTYETRWGCLVGWFGRNLWLWWRVDKQGHVGHAYRWTGRPERQPHKADSEEYQEEGREKLSRDREKIDGVSVCMGIE